MGDLSRGITLLEGQVVTAKDLHDLLDLASINPLAVKTENLAPLCIDATKVQPNAVPNWALAQANPSTLKGNLTDEVANVEDNGVMDVNNALDLGRVDVEGLDPVVTPGYTTAIGGAASPYVRINPEDPNITAFDNVAPGIRRIVLFGGATTLVHNATSLILIPAANRAVVEGDTAEFISEGDGNWRMLWYSQN